MAGFTDVLDREAAWLATSPRTDGLPDLTAAGMFSNIQARQPRTPAKKTTQLYVLHDPSGPASTVERTTNLRAMITHHLMLRLIWPIQSGTGRAEDDQAKFDAAIQAAVTVVMGLPFDHTHGGRFLSAAEDQTRLSVQFMDPYIALTGPTATDRQYEALIRYTVDDFELTN